MSRSWLRLGPAVVYMALIYYLSSQPTVRIGSTDKLLHFAAYAALAMMLLWGLEGNVRPRAGWWAALTISVLYGASDEWHQSFVPGRSPELADVLADAAGAASAALLWLAIPYRWRSRRSKLPGQ